jgi:hypothetical protein
MTNVCRNPGISKGLTYFLATVYEIPLFFLHVYFLTFQHHSLRAYYALYWWNCTLTHKYMRDMKKYKNMHIQLIRSRTEEHIKEKRKPRNWYAPNVI